MLAEKNYKKYHHRYPSGKCCRDSRTFHSQSRHAELTENQRIVTDDIQNIHNYRYHHGINRFVSTTQRGRNSQRYGLKKSECPYYLHVTHSIFHQFGTKPHHGQQESGSIV